MITPAFNLTATERVLPKLALDFTTASLDSRVTFTRTGATATRTNSSGYVEVMAADTPRFDFNAVTLVCKGLLIEESRTNLFLYSQDFSNAAWTKSESTVTANAITSPSGSNDGFKLSETSATSNHQVFQRPVFSITTDYAFSCFAKAGERTKIRLHWNGTTTGLRADVDLITGEVLGGTNVTVQNAGNGWWRISKVMQRSSTGNDLCIAILDDAGAVSYTGDPTKGLYIWGAQFELGSFATSYIPTTTTAVTRNADVATMTGTNFSDWFNASEGTFQVTYIPYSTAASPSQRVIYADNGTTSNRIYFTSTSTTQLAVTSGGVSQAIVAAGTITANQQNSLVGYYKANAFNVAANTTLGTKDTSGSVPVGVNNLRFFKDAGTTNSLFGHIQKMNYWNIAVTDAEISAFSK